MDITKAENVMENLVYTGEKPPHMYWDLFEKRFAMACATIDRVENWQVYSDRQKFQGLLKKVKADFLMATKSSVSVEANKTPMAMTYLEAIQSFRDEVWRKHPETGKYLNARQINEQVSQTGQQRSGRGLRSYRGGQGGRGNCDGRGGRGRGRGGRGQQSGNYHPDVYKVTLKNGRKAWIHSSFTLSDNMYWNLKKEDLHRLWNKREKEGSRSHSRQIQELQETVRSLQQTRDGSSTIASAPEEIQIQQNDTSATYNASRTAFGGRNDQQNKRARINENSSISAVSTATRKIAQTQSQSVYQPEPGTIADIECDSNADTCCLGNNFVILKYTRQTADV